MREDEGSDFIPIYQKSFIFFSKRSRTGVFHDSRHAGIIHAPGHYCRRRPCAASTANACMVLCINTRTNKEYTLFIEFIY